MIHGDSVYDIIDKQDHASIQAQLMQQQQQQSSSASSSSDQEQHPQHPTLASSSSSAPSDHRRIFLCRMNVSRNSRRQMRFGDQKVTFALAPTLF